MKKISLILFSFWSIAYEAQILNAYAKITSVNNSSVLALSNVNIANHTFTVGGQVVVMQMQDNVIGTNTTNVSTFGNLSSIANAGNYEIRTIVAVNPTSGTPTSMTISPALVNTFNTGANSSVQLISFRDLGTNYTTSANITAPTWNGNVGGVIAISVTNTLTLNHRIMADGDGFSGGRYSNDNGGPVCSTGNNTVYITNSANWGFKGEGIYKSTNANFANARGKLLNGGGGGNDHNAGGGGGGNYTAGGQGGNGYNNCTAFPGGGLGGLSLSGQISASRVFLGGGGGGGQQNNAQNSSGGNGGGIILIKAGRLQTSTTCGSSIRISANGNTALSGGNDGMGGGGAGGSIVIEATSISINSTCPLLVSANAGDGGNCNDGTPHAGGGGGGQGVVIYSSAQPTSNTTTQTNNGGAGRDNSGGSYSAGNGAGTNGSGIISGGSGPLPITLIDFNGKINDSKSLLNWSTASEKNNDFFTLEKSEDGINYTFIAQVKGNGTTHSQNNYSAIDNEPIEGINYYRLKQVDYDGASSYSAIISLHYNPTIDFSFFPHPTKSGEDITVILDKNSGIKQISVSIYSLTGTILFSEQVRVESENLNEFKLHNIKLESGVYLLRVDGGNSSRIKKLVIN
jgi:hypothetical protein